jgi:hypothetical protein
VGIRLARRFSLRCCTLRRSPEVRAAARDDRRVTFAVLSKDASITSAAAASRALIDAGWEAISVRHSVNSRRRG